MLPPKVPGIPLKNSNPEIEFCSQNFEIVESFVAPPTTKVFFFYQNEFALSFQSI